MLENYRALEIYVRQTMSWRDCPRLCMSHVRAVDLGQQVNRDIRILEHRCFIICL